MLMELLLCFKTCEDNTEQCTLIYDVSLDTSHLEGSSYHGSRRQLSLGETPSEISDSFNTSEIATI